MNDLGVGGSVKMRTAVAAQASLARSRPVPTCSRPARDSLSEFLIGVSPSGFPIGVAAVLLNSVSCLLPWSLRNRLAVRMRQARIAAN